MSGLSYGMILQAPPCRLITQMLNLIGKEPAHERRIEPEEDSMGRRVHCLTKLVLYQETSSVSKLSAVKKTTIRTLLSRLVNQLITPLDSPLILFLFLAVESYGYQS